MYTGQAVLASEALPKGTGDGPSGQRPGESPGAGEPAWSRVPIRIYTLGRFSVTINGEPVRSNGKGKQKPFCLLKALIALGGRDVAASRIWECLWPDSEGDLGMRNLTITVHRLRRVLQMPLAVLQHDGKLTLNDRVCWVDAWSFDRLANEGLQKLSEQDTRSEAEARLRDALAIYLGKFLNRESEEGWMLSQRLRLETKFERLVTALSRHLEEESKFSEAIDLCRSALEREPLNETLYRRLMSCYLKSGELAEVVRTYRRCWEALSKGLAAQPSEQTQRLYLEGLQAAALRGPPTSHHRIEDMNHGGHGAHGEKAVEQ